MSIIRFEGKLVQTTKKSITEECFNDLIANGRESSFYPFIRQISSDDAFELISRADGRLTLVDLATNNRIDLESFGKDNAAEFAAFLNIAR